MTTILPALERDLHRAARRQLRASAAAPEPTRTATDSGPRRAWRRNRILRALPIAAVALVALIVAGGAVVLLNRISSGTRPAIGTTATISSADARRDLVRTLALLRRPPTASDRKPALLTVALGNPRGTHQSPRDFGSPTLDRALIRVVRIPGDAAHVIVAPARYRPHQGAARTQGIVLTVAGRHGRLNSTGPQPASVTSFLHDGLTVIPALESGAMPGAALVPDGVARVRLGASRLAPGALPKGLTLAQLRPALHSTAMTASVHDNVAIVRLPHTAIAVPGAAESGIGFSTHTPEIWYSRSGAVLRRVVIQSSLVVAVRDTSGPRH